MKLILVPPGLVEPMMRALNLAEGRRELGVFPPVGSMPIVVSPLCPPDTGYILNGEAIPRVEESLWRNEYLGTWAGEAELPPGKYEAFTSSIDFPYQTIIRPRPKGWALLWLRIRYFPSNLIWPFKVWWWKRTGQWED